MILQELNDLYGRLAADSAYQIAQPGYSRQKITFKIVLHPDGTLYAIEDARTHDQKKPRPMQQLVPGGGKPSGQGLNPCLLWDNSSYLLGFSADEDAKKQARAVEEHRAFRDKHLALESPIGSERFSAVCRFLEAWHPDEAINHPVLKDAAKTGFGVFQILGEPVWVHDDDAVAQWWAGQPRDDDVVAGECLVTGQILPLARIHKPKIKGVWGGKVEALLVSFNEDAYTSYGRSQSFNAPVSQKAAFAYGTALSTILDGRLCHKHRIGIGDMTVAFWTERPTVTEDIFAVFVTKGESALEGRDGDDGPAQDPAVCEKLGLFLEALRRGREAYGDLGGDPGGTRFFLLGLSPNAARISVRFFHKGSIADLLERLRLHHRHIGVARRPAAGKRRADPEFPSVNQLLDQTCPRKGDDGRPDRDKIPPILAGPLVRAVITGADYPTGLVQAVLRRIRADQEINYQRCCIIKGYLTRNLGLEVPMSLDTERPDAAYRLGRLFAALEKTQKDALGEGVNATIRDRFYGSASATPASVFPRLLRTYQHHLSKLEGGHRVHREKLVQEILAPVYDFPGHLALPDQGLFALGYYHQQLALYTKRETNAGEPQS